MARWIGWALGLLLIGAALSIAVAVTLALPERPGLRATGFILPAPPDRWLVRVEEGAGVTRVEALRAYDDDRLEERDGGRNVALEMKRSSQVVLFDLGERSAGALPPSWARLERLDRGAGALAAIASGWPFRCLAARAEGRQRAYTAPSMAEVSGAIRVRPVSASFLRDLVRGVIPFSPLWTGLIANSVIYAAVAAAALAGARAARAASRRRRGRCPRCGCDVGRASAAGCPECGSARPASPTSG